MCHFCCCCAIVEAFDTKFSKQSQHLYLEFACEWKAGCFQPLSVFFLLGSERRLDPGVFMEENLLFHPDRVPLRAEESVGFSMRVWGGSLLENAL